MEVFGIDPLAALATAAIATMVSKAADGLVELVKWLWRKRKASAKAGKHAKRP